MSSRGDRRRQRKPAFEQQFGRDCEAALDLVDLAEMAWHDCYGETEIPDQVVADLLTIARGDISRLASAARLAIADWRDLRVNADATRRS